MLRTHKNTETENKMIGRMEYGNVEMKGLVDWTNLKDLKSNCNLQRLACWLFR